MYRIICGREGLDRRGIAAHLHRIRANGQMAAFRKHLVWLAGGGR